MKVAILIVGLVISVSVFSQDQTIVTDRPTQSAASAVVPKGTSILEYGFIYERASANLTNVTWANMLARVGIMEGVEFRLTQNALQVGPSFSSEENISGLSPTTLGTKVHLLNEKGALPQTSVIGQVTLENGEGAFRPESPFPEVRLNFSNTLSDQFSLGYNLGMGFPDDNTYTLYTLVLGYALSDGLTAFVEPYGFFFEDTSDHRFNTGLIYLLKDNFQVDLTVGFGLSESSPDYFIGFGAALGI